MSSLALSPRKAAVPGPRVLLVIPGEEKEAGSSMIFARRQAEAVAAAGAGVKVFFLRSRTSPVMLWSEYRRFRLMREEHGAEVIHAHFGTVTAMFSVLAAGRLPVVITFRGSDLNPATSGALVRSLIGRTLSQLSAPFASAIVCVSEQLRNQLWFARDRVVVLPSGVDTHAFYPLGRAEARQRLGWPEHERVILFNAGHDPVNKRLDLAAAAVKAVQRSLPHVRLEAMAGVTNPSDVPLMMNASDCLLVTSDSEGSPTVVQEALATNLPVVSVAVGDVPERLRGVEHTRIVRRDPEELAEALIELVRVPLRSTGRGHAGEFSAQYIARELFRTYCNVRRPQAVTG